MSKLKPCPLCGHQISDSEADATYIPWRIECSECGARGPEWGDPDRAVKAWNKRPIEDELRQRIAELEARIEHMESGDD